MPLMNEVGFEDEAVLVNIYVIIMLVPNKLIAVVQLRNVHSYLLNFNFHYPAASSGTRTAASSSVTSLGLAARKRDGSFPSRAFRWK